MIPIEQAWCRETSADPDGWTEDNRALGQCAVTALVVQDFLGGIIMRGVTRWQGKGEPLGSHYWNHLYDGTDLDLTRWQFNANVTIDEPGTRSRAYLLSNPDTARRYALLRERMGSLTPVDDASAGHGLGAPRERMTP